MEHEKHYQQFLTQNPYPRVLKSLQKAAGFSLQIDYQDKRMINFSSSDYLGLAHHPLLIQKTQQFTACYGAGVSASRLITGNLACYEELEYQLARVLKKPAALILGTGYQTNQSVLEALLDPRVLGAEPFIFCDKVCHASIVTTIKSFKYFRRFRHNDLQHLQQLLEKIHPTTQPIFILAESLYSMEGDQANLLELSQIAQAYKAFLYIDDAHAVGVYGDQGWGMAPDYAENIAVIMGTFSKALGSFGGYIGCSPIIRNYLINKCKGLIYSTGLPPAVLGAISAVLELLPTLTNARQHVLTLAQQFRLFLKKHELDYGSSCTHIVPWIIGDAIKTVRISQLLEQEGILAMPIQPPSVPVGKSRIRFCWSAAHSTEDLQCLMQAIEKVLKTI